MLKHEILVRPQMKQSEVERMIVDWAKRQDAAARPMGRLVRLYATKGESMHWHVAGLRKGMGTVEVTYLPSTGSLTVLVHDNRRGSWAGQSYKSLATEIENRGKMKYSATKVSQDSC